MGFGSSRFLSLCKIVIGCIIFAVSFNAFLLPFSLNVGGLSGLSMIIVHLFKFGSVGSVAGILNLPLFAIAGIKLGKRFLGLSLLGTVLSSVLIDVMSFISIPSLEPVVGALYGGIFCGLGIGIVFSTGGSTGGSDIIIRLLKLRWCSVPIGVMTIGFDIMIALLTGIVFRDFSRTLYSGIAIFLSGRVIDAVIYRFDYSKTAWIICKNHEAIISMIANNIGRGATIFYGEGSYSHTPLKIVLTAVKRQQLPKLKRLVCELEPGAFVIVQEAHQILGDGFRHISGDVL